MPLAIVRNRCIKSHISLKCTEMNVDLVNVRMLGRHILEKTNLKNFQFHISVGTLGVLLGAACRRYSMSSAGVRGSVGMLTSCSTLHGQCHTVQIDILRTVRCWCLHCDMMHSAFKAWRCILTAHLIGQRLLRCTD